MRRVTDKDIPKLKPQDGSWFLIRRSTGEVITEVFRDNKAVLKSLNADNVEIKTATNHLSSLNRV